MKSWKNEDNVIGPAFLQVDNRQNYVRSYVCGTVPEDRQSWPVEVSLCFLDDHLLAAQGLVMCVYEVLRAHLNYLTWLIFWNRSIVG